MIFILMFLFHTSSVQALEVKEGLPQNWSYRDYKGDAQLLALSQGGAGAFVYESENPSDSFTVTIYQAPLKGQLPSSVNEWRKKIFPSQAKSQDIIESERILKKKYYQARVMMQNSQVFTRMSVLAYVQGRDLVWLVFEDSRDNFSRRAPLVEKLYAHLSRNL